MMFDIFSTAFDATGDPEKGWRLGRRIFAQAESARERMGKSPPGDMKDIFHGLGRRALAEVREFADGERDVQGPPKPVVGPMVHMNGTSKGTLLEDYDNASHAIHQASQLVQAIEFNARDYYPMGMDVWDQACSEMKERLLNLQQVRNELVAIMEKIDKQ